MANQYVRPSVSGSSPKRCPRPRKQARNRQCFELAPTDADQRTEADRLVSLGAGRLEGGADGTVVLVDPDGNELVLLPA